VDSVAGGLSPVPVSFLDPNQPQYAALERTLPRYDYDPQRATQLLTEAGAVRGADGNFRDAAGQPLNVEVRSSPNPQLGKAATAIADNWRRIGVNASPAPITPQLINDRSFTSTFPGFWLRSGPTDVNALRGYTSIATPLASNNFVAPSPANGSRYMSPELDDLIASYFRTIPLNERVEVMGRIVRHVTEQITLLGLYYNTAPGAHTNRVTGIQPQWPSSSFGWNSHEWDVK
jgi:peptide/nickel transport system substrate-binding protein